MIRVVLFPGEAIEVISLEPNHSKFVIDEETLVLLQTIRERGDWLSLLIPFAMKQRKSYKKSLKGTKHDPKKQLKRKKK